ncbi:MAG TPA: hypothetical protein VE973_04130 [Candidatus Limnocylindria bacterium]|nr:hypothetical protein [Candidatus Limnocylindria bacterium]
MNNKKLIIQVVIIVAAFSAAGLILYNGLFKDSSNQTSANPGMVSTQGLTKQAILPYGNSLDFSKLSRFQFDQIEYPVLDVGNEVGVPEENLISSDIAVTEPTPAPPGPAAAKKNPGLR